MKGISPVIATVLLLLMAVAATGGAWVWYQRMQVSSQQGGEGGVTQISSGANAMYVGIDRAYISGGALYFDITNLASEDVTITSIKVKNATSMYDCNTTSTTATSAAVTKGVACSDDYGLSSGNTATAKLYFSGGSSKDITFTVE